MAKVDIGERIVELREDRLLKQTELAEKARISPSTLSLIESGRVPRPHISTLRKIARALEIEPQELTSPKGRAPSSPPEPADEERRPTVFDCARDEARALLGELDDLEQALPLGPRVENAYVEEASLLATLSALSAQATRWETRLSAHFIDPTSRASEDERREAEGVSHLFAQARKDASDLILRLKSEMKDIQFEVGLPRIEEPTEARQRGTGA
jgi:transcriptional regulator with XRE-family HTH domain